MLKAQAVANLASALTGATGSERARSAIQRALDSSGLQSAHTIDEAGMQRLLAALAAEGGAIEEIAADLALHGLDAGRTGGYPTDPTDRHAA